MAAPIPIPRIFIVHGHDEVSLTALRLLLHDNNFLPVVLSNQTNQGDTIIEKLEREFSPNNIAADIVLATPDDEYDSVNGHIARCRPNVDLELGFAIALLSRRKLVYLRKNSIGVNFILPSDVNEIVYTPFDNLNSIQHQILQEFEVFSMIYCTSVVSY